MGWIDVNDKMPPQGLQVLLELSGHGRAENYSYHSNHDFFIGSWIEGGWLVWDCCEGDSHFTNFEVHAWMPLPKHFAKQEIFGTEEDDGFEHPMFEDEPEWLYKGDCVYEQMTIEDFMNQKPRLKQKGVLGIMDYIREYRQQCEDDCKGIERCEKCNQMLFDEIEEIVRRELDD